MSELNTILSIDTSTRIQALGLVVDGALVARRHHLVRTNHAATLLQNVSDILEQHRLEVPDIDLVAVGLGPGSFTGLRVGLANAKALARAADAALAGISSLAAIARPVGDLHRGYVVPVTDARRGELYTGIFEATDSGIRAAGDELTREPEAIRERVLELADSDAVCVVGNGIRAYPELLDDWGDAPVRSLSNGWDSPSPFSIAMLGKARVEAEGSDDLVALEPNYIRLSDAEISWNKRNAS